MSMPERGDTKNSPPWEEKRYLSRVGTLMIVVKLSRFLTLIGVVPMRRVVTVMIAVTIVLTLRSVVTLVNVLTLLNVVTMRVLPLCLVLD